MAKKTVKVVNMINSDVTLNLKDFNDKVLPIKVKGFVKLDEDELSYIMSTSEVFKNGTLAVENKESLSEEVDKEELESSNTLTDKDIANLLRRNYKNLKEGLSEIDSSHTVKRILNYAKDKDKSVKVIEIIENRLEELIK